MFKKFIIIIAILSTILFAEKIDFSKCNTHGTWENSIENDYEPIISMIKRSATQYNLSYDKNREFRDGNITVDFRANKGEIDQGGGVMWRVQDNDNYYVARFNPLEDNFRFYIVHDGIRSELASADVKLKSGWHTMKIEQKGDSFKGYIDAKLYLNLKNSQLKKMGGVGVWTKADAETSFKNLNISRVF